MNKEKKAKIDNNMEDVIATSKSMREYLLNESVPFEERASKLKVLRTALDANKNIVSASVVQVHIENFKL